jgi:hypothetical protein
MLSPLDRCENQTDRRAAGKARNNVEKCRLVFMRTYKRILRKSASI